MPLNLFKKGRKTKELEDLERLTAEEAEIPEAPEPVEESLKLPEDIPDEGIPETEEITEPVSEEMKEELSMPAVGERVETNIEDFPLKDLVNRANSELKNIKGRLREIGNLNNLTLESPEMVDLLDLYAASKGKLRAFIDEVNRMDLSTLSSQKSIAAIYKFRACKTLADIKKQTKKIDDMCKKAGFLPNKVHDILTSNAEDLVNSFMKSKKVEKVEKEKKTETVAEKFGKKKKRK